MGFYQQGVLFLLAIISAASAQRILFMGSNVVRPGANYDATVSSLSQETLSVTVSIVNNVTKQVVNEQVKPVQPGAQEMYAIAIPSTISSTDKYVVRVIDGSPGNIRYQNETEVDIEKKSRSIFIVTDKALYKPGALVKFRTFVLDVQLKPRTEPLSVEIFDPRGNKIKQWLNQNGESGVVSGDLQLPQVAILGDWKIKTTSEMESQDLIFKVDEYVLPKFEVTVAVNPSFIVVSNELPMYMTVDLSALYTIGTPVEGNFTVQVKPQRTWYDVTTLRFVGEISGVRSVQVSFQAGAFKNCGTCSMTVEASVVDKLSGEMRSASTQFNTFTQVEKLEFLDGPKFLKAGLKSQFQLKLTQQDGSPLPQTGKEVIVKTMETSTFGLGGPRAATSLDKTYSFSLPETGILNFEHTTAPATTSLQVEASYNGVTASQYVSQTFKSFNNNSISVERTSPEGGPNSQITFTVRATEDIDRIFYQIVSKKAVEGSGQLNLDPANKLITIPILASPSMAPSSTILVYYLTKSGEIIAASDRFNVQFTFANQMDMTWDASSKKVGESATLTVQASPDSYISAGAVDQSVLLLAESNDITMDRVMSELESYDQKKNDFDGPVLFRGRQKRSFFWRPFFTASDTAKVIEASGLVFMTDAEVYRASQYDGEGILPEMIFRSQGGRLDTVVLQQTYVRSFFPETWLWDQSVTGPNGLATFSVTVPDTLTTWVATAFALHPQFGLGIPSESANLTAFIPFFIRANTPYSVTRGEEITINVNVFNYLGSTTTATIELESSTDFKVKENKNDMAESKALTRSVQVLNNKGASVGFIIVPKVLGTITLKLRASASGRAAADALDQPLLVEPEGRLVETNKPFFFDLSASSGSFSASETITLPAENVVKGSELITISVIGDILGTSLNGLKNLVRMPYGCGEQNMITFTPNIYVRKYFDATGTGSSDMISQTTKFMEDGYIRELKYQRSDGSFSAFGNSDKAGSTWLTAFVVQSFKHASDYIYVDDAILVKSLQWLLRNAYNAESGEFTEVGVVLHKEMQGGSLKTMTAYVLIALQQCRDLETEVPGLLAAITGARQNLEAAVDTISDPYPLAIMAYALHLTNSPKATEILQKLNGMAETRNTDEKYWKVMKKEGGGYHKSNNEVELAAFVLLTHVSRSETTEALPIARFLMSSKNPSGGFGSTQDTVWGLKALSEFGALTRSTNQQFTVTLSYGSRPLGSYSVNLQNSQVLQTQFVESDVIQNGEQVNIEVSGSGTGLIEVSSRYYTTEEETNPTLQLKVNAKQRNPNVREITSCVRLLDGSVKDMIVVEVNDATDFVVDKSSIKAGNKIKMVEKNGKTNAVYYDEFPANEDQCVTMLAYKQADVENVQAPVARAFGYYTGEETTVKMGTTKGSGGTGGCGHVQASFVLALLLTVSVRWLTSN